MEIGIQTFYTTKIQLQECTLHNSCCFSTWESQVFVTKDSGLLPENRWWQNEVQFRILLETNVLRWLCDYVKAVSGSTLHNVKLRFSTQICDVELKSKTACRDKYALVEQFKIFSLSAGVDGAIPHICHRCHDPVMWRHFRLNAKKKTFWEIIVSHFGGQFFFLFGEKWS